ncbi:NADH(P)-binding-domain-containing protein [Chytriomyces sp. MP71]|nr:NADH(P)-binding-domain-containing protein [Chytriomyces sp. MP71]
MDVFRAKHTVAVFETHTKAGAQITHGALAKGHKVHALVSDVSKVPAEWSSHKHFSAIAGKLADADVVASLLAHADVAIIAGGSEDPSGVVRAVGAITRAVAAGKAASLKHVYLVSSAGASATAGIFARAMNGDLINAERAVASLAEKHPNIKFTVFRPPTLIDTDKSNDVFVYDEAAQKNLPDLSNQVSYGGLADAVLEIVETQPRFVNKTAGINSRTLLVEASALTTGTSAAWNTFMKHSGKIIVGSALVLVGLGIIYKKRQGN